MTNPRPGRPRRAREVSRLPVGRLGRLPGRGAAALALALAVAGCGPRPETAGRGCPGCPLPTTDPRAVAATACPDWQWIGMTEAAACPEIPGWEVTEIVAFGGRPRDGGGDRPAPSEPGRTVRRDPAAPDSAYPPPGFASRRYCRYTDRGRGTVATLLQEGPASGLDALDRDCMAVIPLAAAGGAPDAETKSWRELERVFLARAGRPTGLVPGGAPVRLVLIDTVAGRQVHGEPPWSAPWNSPHGVGLANMAKRLTCPGNADDLGGTGCAAVEVEAELALAYVTFDRFSFAGSVRDDVNGGFVGTIGDLAAAIQRAAAGAGAGPTVLNLSVGWNGYLFGGLEDDPADMEAPVRAVYDALDDAVGRGALVVAAAGNRGGGPVTEVDVGPMLPGGWAVHAATAGGTPLLHAAGGLAHEGFASPPAYRSLPNARFRAVPRLLAFADHAVAERHQAAQAEATAILTGSSVASLAVAAGAAAGWTYLPGRSGREVMAEVVAAGEPVAAGVDVASDFCLGGDLGAPDDSPGHPRGWVPAPGCPSAETARRVRVCKAVEAACKAGGGGSCPACGAEDVAPPEVDHAALARFAAAPRLSLGGRRPLDPPDHDLCPPKATRAELTALSATDARLRGASPPAPAAESFHPGGNPGAANRRCPHWQYPSLGSMAWVDPQPESIPCSSCDYGSGSPATLYLEIDPLFWSRLSWPVLVVGDRAYALDWNPDAQPRVIVEDVDYHDGEAVLLSFALDDGLSAVSPLLRVR